ncbi:MAG: rhombosortase, partial [Deltaproteobacteria bacterium]|nr:rhombosortase [Deltaproteobacteria bacterium]
MVAGLPIITLSIMALCIWSFFSPETALVFIYSRDAALKGEAWRLLSSHLVHFSNSHLVCNLLAFGAIGAIMEARSHWRFLALSLLSATSIGTALIIFEPTMSYYGGLSGVICSLIFYITLCETQESGSTKTMAKVFLAVLSVKIAFETLTGNSLFISKEEHG